MDGARKRRTGRKLNRETRSKGRERERRLRESRPSGGRQARALSRLAKAQERDEELTDAEREHEENEQLIAEIRQLLALAPSPQRTASAHARAQEERPFPPRGRQEADTEELERRCEEAALALRPGRSRALRSLVIAAAVLVVGGAAIALSVEPLAWVAPPLGGVLLAAAWGLRGRIHRSAQAAIEERRDAITREIEERFQRDREAHAQAEQTRLERLTDLLAGETEACEEAFRAATEALELPLDAMPLLELLTPRAAEIHVSLHAASEIPAQSSRLLKSGRISYRNRAQKSVREDDTRAMCALSLLAAAAAFDELPTVELVIVSGFRQGIDRATGKDADLCYVSALVERDTIGDLRLDRVDPIAAVRALEFHRLNATKTFILKPVRSFQEDEFEGTSVAPFLSVEVNAKPPAAADAAAAPERPPSAQTEPSSALSRVSHVLTLAMACARADGTVQPEESRALDQLLKDHASHLDPAETAELASLRARFAEGTLAVDAAARTLSTLLKPAERRLLLEQMVGIATADAALVNEERRMLESLAATLDLPPTVLDETLERQEVAGAGAAEDSEAQRRRWLAALELPADARPDRGAVERAASRILDLYAEEKFTLLAPELQKLAGERRKLAQESVDGLLAELPPAPESAATDDGNDGVTTVTRDNPDLDSIFG